MSEPGQKRRRLSDFLDDDRNRWATIMVLLVVLTVVFRLPMTPHELLGDTYTTHAEANRIVVEQDTDWSVDLTKPLSILSADAYDFKAMQKLSPFSGVVLVELGIACASLFSGASIETINFLYPLILAVLGLFGAYLMALELTGNKYMAFAAAFFFCISPLFIRFTFWSASKRHLLTALLPLFVYCLLRYENVRLKRYLVLAAFFFVSFMVTHQMYLLVYIIVIAYFLAKFFSFFYADLMHIKEYFPPVLQKVVVLALPALLIGSFLVLFYVPLFSNQGFFEAMRETYYSGLLFRGESWYIVLANMTLDYISKNSIFMLLSVVGMVFFLQRVNDDFKYLFVTLILLFATPLLFYRMYVTLFTLPFLSLLTGIGLIIVIELLKSVVDFKISLDWREYSKQNIRGKQLMRRIYLEHYIVPAFIVVCILMSIVFSNFIKYHDVTRTTPNTGKPEWMQAQTHHAMRFMESVKANPSFSYNDKKAAAEIRAFLYSEPGSVEQRRQLAREGRELMVVNQDHPTQLEAYGDKLIDWYVIERDPDLYARQDKLYDNGLEGMWSLDSPPRD